jgi:hypothetical protein
MIWGLSAGFFVLAIVSGMLGLVEAVVPVHTCVNIANAMGKAEDFTANGLKLEYARSLRAPCPRKGDGDQLLTLGRGLACCSHRLGGVRSTAIYSRLMCRRASHGRVCECVPESNDASVSGMASAPRNATLIDGMW